MIYELTATTLIIAAISVLSCAFGLAFGGRVGVFDPEKNNPYWIIAASFFIGLVAFLDIWIISSKVTRGAFSSLIISIVVLSFGTYTWRRHIPKSAINIRRAAHVTTAILIFLVIGIFQALTPMPKFFATTPELVSPFSSFGTVSHSFRAGNIAEYIVAKDRLPRINQNIGQSMLAATPAILGENHTQLSLILWMNLLIALTAILVYGFISGFTSYKRYALLGAIVTVAGNNALYAHYVSLSDNGVSTIIFSSNADALLGITTFLILISIIWNMLEKQSRDRNMAILAIIAIITASWGFTAGQNIIMALPFFIVVWLIYRKRGVAKVLAAILVTFTLSAGLGAIQGGMILPTRLAEKPPIPGIMEVERDDYKPITIHAPEIWQSHSTTLSDAKSIYARLFQNHTSTIFGTSTSDPVMSNDTDKNNIDSGSGNSDLIDKFKVYMHLSGLTDLIGTLRALFFPLLGLILSTVLLAKRRKEENYRLIVMVTGLGAISFLGGAMISSSIDLYGYSFELTRFMYAGIFLCKLLLGISIARLMCLLSSLKNKAAYAVMVVLATFMICGPAAEYAVRLAKNMFLPFSGDGRTTEIPEGTQSQTLNINERLSLLIGMDSIVGRERSDYGEFKPIN